MEKNNIYTIYATRETSQFNQKKQIMRCRVIEIYSDHMLVESLKRYNKKYAGANVSELGIPLRRINKDQAKVIIDEKTGKWITWETVKKRENKLNIKISKSKLGKKK